MERFELVRGDDRGFTAKRDSTPDPWRKALGPGVGARAPGRVGPEVDIRSMCLLAHRQVPEQAGGAGAVRPHPGIAEGAVIALVIPAANSPIAITYLAILPNNGSMALARSAVLVTSVF